MSVTDYNALKRYLETPGEIATTDDASRTWKYRTVDKFDRRWRKAQRSFVNAGPTHHFNPTDDRRSLQGQAEEAARLLEMGRECPTCDGDGWTWRDDEDFAPGRETCFDCNSTGWENGSDTPAIDRLAIAKMGRASYRRRRLHEPIEEYRREVLPAAPTYALPTSPCETCGGTGECFRLGRSRPPDSCASCNGTGRKPDHQHQQPRDWDAEARDVRGPGVRGLRMTMTDVLGDPPMPLVELEPDYSCGDYPTPGGKAWRIKATNEVRSDRETSPHGKWYESEIRARRVQRALDIGLHLSDGAKHALSRARLVAAPHNQRWRDAYQAIQGAMIL